MNLIDPPVPLFMRESFEAFFRFACRFWDGGANILIHCNKGESRAPSLALLLLAKHLRAIAAESYDDAMGAFVKLYPEYSQGIGIQKFLRDNWRQLDIRAD
jgi:predicted protein tyrosine phosphatase